MACGFTAAFRTGRDTDRVVHVRLGRSGRETSPTAKKQPLQAAEKQLRWDREERERCERETVQALPDEQPH